VVKDQNAAVQSLQENCRFDFCVMTNLVSAPKISVLMVTYNHEPYIAKALDSVFAQQHDYSYEVVLGDDASTDRTYEIIQHYSQLHPGKINLIRHPTNVGHSNNYRRLLDECRGDYIAFLDGDDYWTDPEKLKKQISFLDENPEYVLSCHRFRQHFIREDRVEDDLYPDLYEDKPDGFVMDRETFFSNWVVQTLAVVVRRSAVTPEIPGFRRYQHFTDMHIFFSVLLHGKGYAHGFFGGVYNMHGHGLWSKLDKYQQFEFNAHVLSELIETYPDSRALKWAYFINRRTLLWLECGQILSKRLSWKSTARLASIAPKLGLAFFEQFTITGQ
jgi:glycosyltransferase involved in cell wall biosynthesis